MLSKEKETCEILKKLLTSVLKGHTKVEETTFEGMPCKVVQTEEMRLLINEFWIKFDTTN